MTHQMFHVVQINPNDVTGGGGCICSPTKQIDCKPPYIVFYGNDMESPISPHVVICQACLDAGQRACSGEILPGGETGITLPQEDVEELTSLDEDWPI